MTVAILVVDDEPDVVELFSQRFRREVRREQFALHFAGTGKEALDLLVEALGRSSITFLVTGRDRAGKTLFRAKLISCFVSRPAFKPIAIPQEFRDRIQAYRSDCDMRRGEDG